MIEQLKGHITDGQLDEICESILAQYRRYLKYTNTTEHDRLFAPEYASHRKQHELSHAIVSAFRDESIVAGFTVSCQKDNGGHTRPELHSNTLILHIQSKGTNFQAEYLKDYYRINRKKFSNSCLYAYIVFEEKEKKLIRVTLCLPDEVGKVVDKTILLDQKKIIELAS